SNVLSHKATSHQKNSGTLFCAVNINEVKIFARPAQNHCVLGLVVPIILFCYCFFDLPALGIDGRSSVKPVSFQSKLA
ncbi:hypothetical protein, partial [Pedobacter sp. UBA5917]|uniref:hypothetical protein n=1 Tax=Pedobacter sp. UBA5917 TaxID=1947061 RepID=UPI0025EFB71E